MKPNDYQTLALRTAGAFATANERLSAWALGIAGESAEILAEVTKRQNVKIELGDCLWYVAAFADASGVTLRQLLGARSFEEFQGAQQIWHDAGEPRDDVRHAHALLMRAAQLCESVKKLCYHGRESARHDAIEAAMDCAGHLAIIASARGLSLDEVAQANILKLEARYPKGFSHEASNNRRT